MNKWIDIRDRTPDCVGRYLVTVFNPDYPDNPTSVDIDTYHPESNTWDEYEINWRLEQVTHWMPLPELPPFDSKKQIISKKLNQSIFKHPNCPDWAKSAAIDDDGRCFVYSCYAKDLDKHLGSWFPISTDSKDMCIDDGYDIANWKISAINRNN